MIKKTSNKNDNLGILFDIEHSVVVQYSINNLVKLEITNPKEQFVPSSEYLLVLNLECSSSNVRSKNNVIIFQQDSGTSEEKTSYAIVVKCGSDCNNFQEGDFVLYEKWSGYCINYGRLKYAIVNKKFIISKVKKI